MNVFLKYLSSGSIIFAFNMCMTWIAIQFPITHKNELNSNIAHFIVTELALLFAFFMHNTFTWSGTGSFLFKIWRFHLVSLFSLLLRFLIFFLLMKNGFSFVLSTLAGIAVSMTLNFIGYDRLVFPEQNFNDIINPNPVGKKALKAIDGAQNYNNWIANKIKPYLGKKNIELGAGIGTISQCLVSDQHDLTLIEKDNTNRNILENKFKNKKKSINFKKDLDNIKNLDSYDCIYSSNVLEHIQNDLEIIQKSLSLLKTGGYFAAFVPAGFFLYTQMDKSLGHYRRYDWNDYFRIKRMLKTESRGTLAHYKFYNLFGAIGWFIKMKILNQSEIRKSDVFFMNSLIPYLSKLDFFPLPVGQNIFFVIKKL